MRQLGWVIGLCAMLALTDCRPRRGAESTADRQAGTARVFIYLQALDMQAGSLIARLDSAAAQELDGESRPLRLENAVIDGTAPRRQQLLATGTLPVGSYRGLRFRAADASIERDGARIDLTVGEDPGSTAYSFRAETGQVVVLTLRLESGRAIVDDRAFEPAFSIGAPSAAGLAPAAVALASVESADALIVFHKLTGEVFDVLPTGAGPRGVAYDALRRRAYVACSGSDTVEAFDLVRGIREQSFRLQFADEPNGLVLSRDGRTLVVVNPASNSLNILDAPTLAERFRIQVGREPLAAVLDPQDRRAFVFLRGDNSVAVVDLSRGAVIASLKTESGPVFGVLADDGRELVVIHRDSPYLSRIDLEELTVQRGPYVGIGAVAAAVDRRTDRIYLSRQRTGTIEVFDPGSGLPIDSLALGSDATFLDIDDEAEQLYVVLPEAGQVRALRLSGRRFTTSTDVGGRSRWIDVAGSRP